MPGLFGNNNDYVVQQDAGDAAQAFNVGNTVVFDKMFESKAKTVAGIGYSIGVSFSGIPLIGGIPAAISAVKTEHHILQLEHIQRGVANACECRYCDQTLYYVIAQKRTKRNRKVASALPVIGTLNTIYVKIHRLMKDNPGDVRLRYAVTLWHSAREGCPRARAIVAELVGASTAEKIRTADKGYEVLFPKLAST